MNPIRRNTLLMLLMFCVSGLAMAFYPTHKIADDRPGVDLDAVIPKQFVDWKLDETIIPIQASPEVQTKLDKIYSQTLNRTYVNSLGERVMLSIAYGSNQGNDDFQVHRPEYCYQAQGFQVGDSTDVVLDVDGKKFPARRLDAVKGIRVEPITYWITIGDKATLPGIGRKLAQLKYGLTGKVPDGMLVRVSSINSDERLAYELQQKYVADLLASMKPADRVRLTGL